MNVLDVMAQLEALGTQQTKKRLFAMVPLALYLE